MENKFVVFSYNGESFEILPLPIPPKAKVGPEATSLGGFPTREAAVRYINRLKD